MVKVLSLIFPALLVSLCLSAQNNIHIDEASKHVGEVVTICDKIYEGKFEKDEEAQPTFLNMGGSFPKKNITILINFEDRKNFTDAPETFYVQKDVCITGKIIKVKDKLEIVITKPTDLQIGTE